MFFCLLWFLLGITGLLIISLGILYFVSKSGSYPAGADTLCHIYKGEILYESIKQGNFYPLFDMKWYNGVEPLRYWAPLPVYILAGLQGILGGDSMKAYLWLVVIIFYFGALVWWKIGMELHRSFLGYFLGILWFFMPNNLYALLIEGNLPRGICMIVLPLFFFEIYEYLEKKNWWRLVSITILFAFMSLCHMGYAGMIAIGFLIFAIIHGIQFRSWKYLKNCVISIILGFGLIGIWLYPSLKGGITSTDSSQVMKSFFQDLWISLNPILRLSTQDYFYFGLASALLAIFGLFFSKKQCRGGFLTAFIILICTTTTMYSLIVRLPGSQYLWMLRFISIALVLILLSLLYWSSLRKGILVLVCFLLVLDTIPSLWLLYGTDHGVTPQQRFEKREAQTLIDKGKELTTQRMALLDLSSLEAEGAYLVSAGERGVNATYGAGWQSAATASNIVQLNQALEDGFYLYLFDRCIELGNDVVLIQKNKLQYQQNDVENLNTIATRLGYVLVEENEEYLLYHLDTYQQFGVISEYKAIGIGTSAPSMSLMYPVIEETQSNNLNDYTAEQLSQYEVVYLAGFTYDDKEAAEDMLRQISQKGTRVVILADGIPIDKEKQTKSFLGVTCYDIQFSNGYPALQTKNGELYTSLFPEGYQNWNTVYMNGLDQSWGKIEDLGKELDFYGTVENDNIIMLGLNLSYHYALTQDAAVATILSDMMSIHSYELPKRELVPIHVTTDKNQVVIESPKDQVNTTLSYHDNFVSKQSLKTSQQLVIVDKGVTKINMKYPYKEAGLIISIGTLLVAIIFFGYQRKDEHKNR